MLKKSIWESFRPNNLLVQIIVGLVCGLVLGIAFLLFSPFLVLGALAAIVVLYAILKRPEIGLLGILIATSSIVFEDQLPALTVKGISLQIPDLILLLLLGLIVIRSLVEPDFKLVHTPLDWPLLIFLGVALLSTLMAVLYSSVDSVEARRAIRQVSYYLTFFVVTNLVQEASHLRFLLKGLFFLATIVAAAMIIQYAMGDSVQILSGQVATLETAGEVFSGTTRIVPPGLSLLIVSFISIIVVMSMDIFKLRSVLGVLQLALLGLAVVMTFLRSYWVGIGVALFLLAYLSRGQARRRILGWGLLVVVFLSMIIPLIVFFNPDSQVGKLLGGSFARLSTLGNTATLNEGSLQWRYVENEDALASILAHPILGVGLGAQYRPWDPRIDFIGMGWDARSYIHNGYLWIFVDTGVLGYLAFMWLSLTFLWRGFRTWRSIANEELKGAVLGFTLVYLVVLIAAVVNSIFVGWSWTPVIGIIMGANEVVFLKFRQEKSIV